MCSLEQLSSSPRFVKLLFHEATGEKLYCSTSFTTASIMTVRREGISEKENK